MKQQRFSLDMPEEHHKKIKLYCVSVGIRIRDFIINATLEKLKKCEKEDSKDLSKER